MKWMISLLGCLCVGVCAEQKSLGELDYSPEAIEALNEVGLWRELSVIAQTGNQIMRREPRSQWDKENTVILISEMILKRMVALEVLEEEQFVVPLEVDKKGVADEKFRMLVKFADELGKKYGRISVLEMLNMGSRMMAESFVCLNLRVRLPKKEMENFEKYLEKHKLGFKSETLVRRAQVVCENVYSNAKVAKKDLGGGVTQFGREKVEAEDAALLDKAIGNLVKHGVFVKKEFKIDWGKAEKTKGEGLSRFMAAISSRYGVYLTQDLIRFDGERGRAGEQGKISIILPFEMMEKFEKVVKPFLIEGKVGEK